MIQWTPWCCTEASDGTLSYTRINLLPTTGSGSTASSSAPGRKLTRYMYIACLEVICNYHWEVRDVSII